MMRSWEDSRKHLASLALQIEAFSRGQEMREILLSESERRGKWILARGKRAASMGLEMRANVRGSNMWVFLLHKLYVNPSLRSQYGTDSCKSLPWDNREVCHPRCKQDMDICRLLGDGDTHSFSAEEWQDFNFKNVIFMYHEFKEGKTKG